MRQRLLLLARPSILWVGVFIVFLELTLRFFPGVVMVFGANMDFHRYYAEQRALSNRDEIEVLIVGDSSIQNGVMAREVARGLGLPDKGVFNLSYGGGSANTVMPFLRMNLDEFTKLRTVVWIYNDYRFTNHGCRYIEHLTMDFAQMVEELDWYYLATSDALLKNFSILYRLIDFWRIENARFLFAHRYFHEREAYFYLPDGGGYMVSEGAKTERLSRSNYTPWLSDYLKKALDWYRDPSQCDLNVRAVVELSRQLEQEQIRFVALRHAVQQNARKYFDRIAPEHENYADIGMAPIVDSNLGVVHKDILFGFIPSSSSYYWDFQHLNYFGAMEYSRYIAERAGHLIMGKSDKYQ